LATIAPISAQLPSPDGVALRVVTANVLWENPEPEHLAHELANLNAQVVMLQEVTPGFAEFMEKPPFSDAYPHCHADPRPDAFGAALCSSFRLLDAASVKLEIVPAIRAEIDVGDARVHLVTVHFTPPVSTVLHDYWMSQASGYLKTLYPGGVPDHLLVAGDFNMTSLNPTFEVLTRQLNDASQQAGGLPMWTWPNGAGFAPPLEIDHVLFSDAFSVHQIDLSTGRGSDHRPVVADLIFTP